MPTPSAPAQFSRRSSTNTHPSGSTPRRCDAIQDHDNDKQRDDEFGALRLAAGRQQDDGRRNAVGRQDDGKDQAHRRDHRLAWLHAAKHAVDQVGGILQAEALREAALELLLLNSPGLELPEVGKRRGILAKHAQHRVLRETLLPAEVREAAPHRGGEDAAEVNQ